MSRFTEIQKQYQGYVAAKEAVERTHPEKWEAVYKNGQDGHSGFDGIIIYDPNKNIIIIRPQRFNTTSGIEINPEDIPALIEALRELVE
jgi:hypothetical protein